MIKKFTTDFINNLRQEGVKITEKDVVKLTDAIFSGFIEFLNTKDKRLCALTFETKHNILSIASDHVCDGYYITNDDINTKNTFKFEDNKDSIINIIKKIGYDKYFIRFLVEPEFFVSIFIDTIFDYSKITDIEINKFIKELKHEVK